MTLALIHNGSTINILYNITRVKRIMSPTVKDKCLAVQYYRSGDKLSHGMMFPEEGITIIGTGVRI